MEKIETIIKEIKQLKFNQKEVLTFEEACFYSGMSKSSMYKLTSTKQIPHYKPKGKLLFFKKDELVDWLLTNRQSSLEELESQAIQHSLNTKRFYNER